MSSVTATLGGTPTSLSSVANVPPVDTIVIASKDHQLGSYSASIQAQIRSGGGGGSASSSSSAKMFNHTVGSGSLSPRRPGPSEDPIILLRSAELREKRKLVPTAPPPPFSPNIKRHVQANLSPRNLGIPPDPVAIQQAVDDENWSLRDDDGPVKCAPVTAFDEERFRNYVRQQRTVLRHTHTPRRIKADEFVPSANINTHRRGDLVAIPEVAAGSVSTASGSARIPAPPASPAPSTTASQPRMKASDYHGKQDLLESFQPQSMRPSPIQHRRHHLAVLSDYMTQGEREKLAAEIRHELHVAQLQRRGQQFQKRRKEYDERVMGNTIAADRCRNDSTDPTSEVLESLLPTEITFYVKNPDCNVRGKEYLRLPVPNSHGIKRIIDEQANFLTKARNPYNIKGAKAGLSEGLHGTIYPDFTTQAQQVFGGSPSSSSVMMATAATTTPARNTYVRGDHTGDTTSEDEDPVDSPVAGSSPAGGGNTKKSKKTHHSDIVASSSPGVVSPRVMTIHDDRDPSRVVVLNQLKAFTAGRFSSKTGDYRPPANHPTGSVTGVLKSAINDKGTSDVLRVQGVRTARRTSNPPHLQRVMSDDPNLELRAQHRVASRRDAPFLFNTQPPTPAGTSQSLSGVSFGNGNTVVPILEGVLLFSRLYEALNGSSAGTPGLTAVCKEALLMRLLDGFPTLVSSVITKRAFIASATPGTGVGSAELSVSQFVHQLALLPPVRMRRLPRPTVSTMGQYTLGTPVAVGAIVSDGGDGSPQPASRMHPSKASEIAGVVSNIVEGLTVTPRTVLAQRKDMIASRKLGNNSGPLSPFGSSVYLPAILDRTIEDPIPSVDTKFTYPDSMVTAERQHTNNHHHPKPTPADIASVRPWEEIFRIVDSTLTGSAPRELLLLGLLAAASAVPTSLDSDPSAYRVDVSTPNGCIRGLSAAALGSTGRQRQKSPIRQQSSIRTDRYDTLTYATLWVASLLCLRAQGDTPLPLGEAFAIRDALKAVAAAEANALESYRRGRQNVLLVSSSNGNGGPTSVRRRSPPRVVQDVQSVGSAVTAHQHLSSVDIIAVVEAACEHAIKEHRLLGCSELADVLLAALAGKEPTYAEQN